MLQSTYTYVTLNVVERAHNYIFISSDEVPELNLWGPPSQVLSEIEPALKALFRHNNGVEVDVIPVAPAQRFPLPPEGEFPPGYVVQLAA